jgi:hypothetical protein
MPLGGHVWALNQVNMHLNRYRTVSRLERVQGLEMSTCQVASHKTFMHAGSAHITDFFSRITSTQSEKEAGSSHEPSRPSTPSRSGTSTLPRQDSRADVDRPERQNSLAERRQLLAEAAQRRADQLTGLGCTILREQQLDGACHPGESVYCDEASLASRGRHVQRHIHHEKVGEQEAITGSDVVDLTDAHTDCTVIAESTSADQSSAATPCRFSAAAQPTPGKPPEHQMAGLQHMTTICCPCCGKRWKQTQISNQEISLHVDECIRKLDQVQNT